jgi:hypothetical protein
METTDELMINPYPASWLDRFTEWVERLPGPTWVFYIAMGLVLASMTTVVDWGIGLYPIGTFNVFHIWLAIQSPYLLALIRYLDEAAERALKKFRPALEVNKEEYAELRYRLTTTPARPMLLFTLAGFALNVLIFLLFPDAQTLLDYTTGATSLIIAFGLQSLNMGLPFALAYHTIHQLRLVSHIYAEHAKVNLFDLSPLYAFSVLTSQTAVGVIFYNFIWTLTIPGGMSFRVGGILFGIPFSILNIITFMWPLLGIHGRLVQEKQRLLRENSQLLETTIAEQYRRVQASELHSIDELHVTKANLEILEIGRSMLIRIPTWPWQPGTLRGFVTALLLPLVVFVLQFVIQRFLTQ